MPAVVRLIAPVGKGKPAPYSIAPAPCGPFDLVALDVTSQGRKPRTHRVRLDALGWHCDCPDAKYRASRDRRECKHVGVCRELYEAHEVIMAATKKATTNEPRREAEVADAGPRTAETTAEVRQQQATVPAAPAPAPAVYGAIAKVQAALSREGIAKQQMQPGIKSRGIDAVLNALSPLLVEAGLLILPRVVSREAVERTSSKGGALYFAAVFVEYDFVAVSDGSRHVIATVGEAMDVSDKATNKAMSAAFKYACFQAFCIPIEGTPDADAETHEVAAPATAQVPSKAPPPQTTPAPHAGANGAARKASPVDAEPTVWQQALAFEARLVERGLCRPGELQAKLKADAMLALTWGKPAEDWLDDAQKQVEAECRAFAREKHGKGTSPDQE